MAGFATLLSPNAGTLGVAKASDLIPAVPFFGLLFA